ncbi:mitochondrial splicing system protein [Apophysomyces sp. BC1015]|nr:mitochondrial splicing system protein [Apophysomyces sp. BC1015]KAG0176419.1 mitochondrial splicing system protein [Apophysomyces sp. BC1021]
MACRWAGRSLLHFSRKWPQVPGLMPALRKQELWNKPCFGNFRPGIALKLQRFNHTPAQTIYALSTSPDSAKNGWTGSSRASESLLSADTTPIDWPSAGSWTCVVVSCFTGEHTVEFHIHGGNAVVKSVLNALNSMENFRMAEQGEFARRAFYNDKLDLTELEGLADLLNAETEVQRQLALRQAEGGLRIPYEAWREQIIFCMANTEAVIDFGEDEQIEDDVLDKVAKDILDLRNSIQHHLNDSRVGEIVRSGIQVAIVGPPNAGKSTFLNRLAKREAAIVSDIPGTTRDVVEVTLNLGGYPIVVSDTAGLRESKDMIEMEGVKRAKSRLRTSDIKICLLSLGQLHIESDRISIDKIVRDVIDNETFVILNKQDISEGMDTVKLAKAVERVTGARKVWTMSCKTSQGLDIFLQDMIGILKARFDESIASPVLITQARHRQHLEDCVKSLNAFLDMPMEDVVLSAEELRQAANALGRITGRVDVEDVLDVLFGQFCIGK